MDIEEIRSGFVTLHRDVAQLMTEVLHTRPSLVLVLRRKRLRQLEDRLDGQLRRFVELDAELIAHTSPPSDINSALRSSARFSLYLAARDSARGLISETYGGLGSLRSQLDFRGSLAISILALAVGVIALFAG